LKRGLSLSGLCFKFRIFRASGVCCREGRNEPSPFSLTAFAIPHRPKVGSQPATEALPLVMEPESRLYTSPVVVLDFQARHFSGRGV
jgi:hypothetical protein